MPSSLRSLHISVERWPFARPFTVSGGREFVAAPVVHVEIRAGAAVGRGEAAPFVRYGETTNTVLARIESVRQAIEVGADRGELPTLLPPGPARNALDCALWDLTAKQAGQPVWQLAGLREPSPRVTSFTVGLDTPAAMAASAAAHCNFQVLKLKLGGDEDVACVEAVRQAAPGCRLMIDANEGWTPEHYDRIVPKLIGLGVQLIEQPFHADQDIVLAALPRPIPVCADESCHTSADLDRLVGLYDFVNIKLDKTGGLTEALRLAARAKICGFRLMVGCMAGTSLGMAPAHLVAQLTECADIDAPLILATDRAPGLRYEGDLVHPPERALWG